MRAHRHGGAALLLYGLAFMTGTSAAPQDAGRFTVYGLAPAAAGQDLAQAEAVLGEPLVPEPSSAPRAASAATIGSSSSTNTSTAAASAAAGRCHHRLSARQPGVRYTVTDLVITRIETRDPRYSTRSGVHVGDTVAHVQQVYGKQLVSAPHPYFDHGKVLSISTPDRRFALVMEANDQGRIITLRAGRMPEVGWLEGCS